MIDPCSHLSVRDSVPAVGVTHLSLSLCLLSPLPALFLPLLWLRSVLSAGLEISCILYRKYGLNTVLLYLIPRLSGLPLSQYFLHTIQTLQKHVMITANGASDCKAVFLFLRQLKNYYTYSAATVIMCFFPGIFCLIRELIEQR